MIALDRPLAPVAPQVPPVRAAASLIGARRGPRGSPPMEYRDDLHHA